MMIGLLHGNASSITPPQPSTVVSASIQLASTSSRIAPATTTTTSTTGLVCGIAVIAIHLVAFGTFWVLRHLNGLPIQVRSTIDAASSFGADGYDEEQSERCVLITATTEAPVGEESGKSSSSSSIILTEKLQQRHSNNVNEIGAGQSQQKKFHLTQSHSHHHRPHPSSSSSITARTTLSANCLLVIAHPDDETMFFGPTILSLGKSGVRIHVLCLTAGRPATDVLAQNTTADPSTNDLPATTSTHSEMTKGRRDDNKNNKLNNDRKNELLNAVGVYGISQSDVVVLDDPDHFPDGFVEWHLHEDTQQTLSNVILEHIKRFQCNMVITFDGYGVSGHPNHVACWSAVHRLYNSERWPNGVHAFMLESTCLLRKYSSFADLFYSFMEAPFMHVSTNPLPIYRAMTCHRSQLVWFRYLYMLFSRYIFINTFRRIPIKKHRPRGRKDE